MTILQLFFGGKCFVTSCLVVNNVKDDRFSFYFSNQVAVISLFQRFVLFARYIVFHLHVLYQLVSVAANVILNV